MVHDADGKVPVRQTLELDGDEAVQVDTTNQPTLKFGGGDGSKHASQDLLIAELSDGSIVESLKALVAMGAIVIAAGVMAVAIAVTMATAMVAVAMTMVVIMMQRHPLFSDELKKSLPEDMR